VDQKVHASRLVAGLGGAQLVAWGTLYYGIALLGEPMGLDLGLSAGQVFGAFGWCMLISGALAPWAGRTLDRLGGRTVLASSAIVGALGFVVLARATSFSGLVAGWSIQGLAMALGLYDACFAAIGHLAPRSYRRIVTGVTLVAGLASTVSWPATYYLVRSIGWRASCDLYAVALLLCAPLYAFVLAPSAGPRAHPSAKAVRSAELSAALHKRARWLAWAFAGAALVGASISAHLVGVLKALHAPHDHALWAAAAIGVTQVAGRALELLFGARIHPARLAFATFAGMVAAMMLLLSVSVLPFALYGFALVYGVANGLSTIAKATLPVEMFGFANVGAVLGSFGASSVIARALAPFAFAVTSERAGTEAALLGLVAVSVAACAAYAAATPRVSGDAVVPTKAPCQ